MNRKINNLLLKSSASWRFPGNVNDNFKTLYTIAKHDKSLLSPEALGKITKMLISLEKKPGGPYYSEFPDTVSGKKKRTVDKETNKNIARFLSLYGIDLPALRPFYRLPRKTEGSTKRPNKIYFTKNEKEIMHGIQKCFQKKMSSFSRDITEPAKMTFEQTILGNTDKQMSLVPYYLKLALGKEGEKINQKTIEELGVINIFFWTAFIIYDDFWDEDEKAQPRFLPVANLFTRYHTQYWNSCLPEKPAFRKMFSRLMNHLDMANSWEIKHCRAVVDGSIIHLPKKLPDYKDYLHKYEPASGHTLAPVLLLYMVGKEKEVENLITYFRHLLISMQINDDMHDLEEDLKRGHISTAVEPLLRLLPRSKQKLDLQLEIPELKKIFWSKVLPVLAKKSIAHAEESLKALSTIKFKGDVTALELLAKKCKISGEQAIKEHSDSSAFIFSLSNL